MVVVAPPPLPRRSLPPVRAAGGDLAGGFRPLPRISVPSRGWRCRVGGRRPCRTFHRVLVRLRVARRDPGPVRALRRPLARDGGSPSSRRSPPPGRRSGTAGRRSRLLSSPRGRSSGSGSPGTRRDSTPSRRPSAPRRAGTWKCSAGSSHGNWQEIGRVFDPGLGHPEVRVREAEWPPGDRVRQAERRANDQADEAERRAEAADEEARKARGPGGRMAKRGNGSGVTRRHAPNTGS